MDGNLQICLEPINQLQHFLTIRKQIVSMYENVQYVMNLFLVFTVFVIYLKFEHFPFFVTNSDIFYLFPFSHENLIPLHF